MINQMMENLGMQGIFHFVSQNVEETNSYSAPSGTVVKELDAQFEEEFSAFSEFIGKYGRSYATKNDHMGKFEVFRANYRDIVAHNERHAAGELTWTKAVNHFSDLTPEEFHATYLQAQMRKPETLKEVKNQKPHMVKASHVPEYVNWYEQGKVSESVDQGGCGACWAFTSATVLESLNAIQNNLDKVPKYSVQYLMDCDDVNWACEGGWMADAWDFTKVNGIIGWDEYPTDYTGRKGKCRDPGNKATQRFFNAESHEEDKITNDRLKELVAEGPVGAAIYSNFGCLGSYGSGIILDKDCDCSNPDRTDVNHAITVVGYGKSDSSKCSEYWIIKNSWGPYWGDHGHFKLCAERSGRTSEWGTCQINSYVQFARV